MRKLLCMLLVSSMIFTAACGFDMGKDKAEAVNKGINTRDTSTMKTAERTPAGVDTGKKSDSEIQSLGTPEPVKEVVTTGGKTVSNADDKVKSAVLVSSEKQRGPSIVMYYQDMEGSIVPLSRRVEKQDGIAKAAVNGLVDNAINREEIEHYGVYPVLPMGTQVLGINIAAGIGTIDFNSKLLNYSSETAERSIISSVVYTLTQFKTITGVRIWIDGKPQKKLKYGSDISGVLDRKNTLINANKLNADPEMMKSDVFVIKNIKENLSYNIPVSMEFDKIKDEMRPYKIVELLAGAFSQGKFYSLLPPNTRLIDYTAKGNLLTLNFNKEIRNYGGNSREEAIIRQILYTAKQFEGINKVKILIEGKEAVLPEGTELYDEITLPEVLNDLIEE